MSLRRLWRNFGLKVSTISRGRFEQRIRELADLIVKAKRPLIVASTGVFYSKAWDELKAAAEKAEIAVVESRRACPHPVKAPDILVVRFPGPLRRN